MRKKTETLKEAQPRSPNAAFDVSRNKSTAASGEDIIELILNHHEPLKAMIESLKESKTSRKAKAETFEEFAYLLTCHAKAEEQVLYVAMKNFEELKTQGFEGDTEHAIADQLVQEINGTPNDHEWLAKVKVLAEAVEHHIQEEEEKFLKHVETVISPAQRKNLGAEYTRLLEEFQNLYDVLPPKNIKFRKVSLPPVAHIQ